MKIVDSMQKKNIELQVARYMLVSTEALIEKLQHPLRELLDLLRLFKVGLQQSRMQIEDEQQQQQQQYDHSANDDRY